MTFTDKDKMLARKYREAGYKWIARENDGTLWIYDDKPFKVVAIFFYTGEPPKKVDKRNFKPVQFSDIEPTRLDDIIGEEK